MPAMYYPVFTAFLCGFKQDWFIATASCCTKFYSLKEFEGANCGLSATHFFNRDFCNPNPVSHGKFI